MPPYAIGVDIGGTFTDCFLTDGVRGWRGKAPTTPGALADGLVAAPEVAAALDRLVGEEGVEALAVCLLWSFRNPVHERRVAALAAERYPTLQVSCSAELFPVIREYERMTATVLNAYTSRAGSAFFDAVEGRLTAAGLRVPVAVMQSSGGTFGPAEARARPVVLAQSGPVAGVAAARALAQAARLGDGL